MCEPKKFTKQLFMESTTGTKIPTVLTMTWDLVSITDNEPPFKTKKVEPFGLMAELTMPDGKRIVIQAEHLKTFHRDDDLRFMPLQAKETFAKYPETTVITVSSKQLLVNIDVNAQLHDAIEALYLELKTMTDATVKSPDELKRDQLELDKKNAYEIIDKANRAGGFDSLMTNAEYVQWQYNYKQTNLEGGDGYIPEYVTKEQYKKAEDVLGLKA